MNYYRRFPGDYLRDTMGLSMTEHGAYGLLLDYLYATETPIRDMAHALQICNVRTEEERFSLQRVFERFFIETRGGFTNKRVDKELKTRKDWRKWQKKHRDTKPDKALTVRPMSSRSPLPLPLPLKTEEKSNTMSAGADAHTPPPRILFEIFEQERGGLAGVRELTPDRLSKCRSRLLNHKADQQKFLAEFRAAVRKAGQLAWPEWRPHFDWFISNDSNLLKVLEGKYDNWGGGNGTRQPNTSREQTRAERSQQAIERAFGHRSGLADALRANVPRGDHGGDGPALPRSVEGHQTRPAAPGVSPGGKDLQVPPDTKRSA